MGMPFWTGPRCHQGGREGIQTDSANHGGAALNQLGPAGANQSTSLNGQGALLHCPLPEPDLFTRWQHEANSAGRTHAGARPWQQWPMC